MLPVLQRRCPEPGAAAAESPRGAGAAGAGSGSVAGTRPVPLHRGALPGTAGPAAPPPAPVLSSPRVPVPQVRGHPSRCLPELIGFSSVVTEGGGN